ncbi:zinc metalloproteinase nas-6-like [Acanthaster planci]|uniref:Metalloendopeptidase n=1 Tax=Acanthaster planci TaxID=133434 RepID=A0A8B7XTC5_ACAPL|nr:zinc metalloproteinase nas-6-like [Acanthaster planci]
MSLARKTIVLLLGAYMTAALPLPEEPDTFDNATLDLRPNGMPAFEIIAVEPTFEQMEMFGTKNEEDSMDLIVKQYFQMTPDLRNITFEGDVVLGFDVDEYNMTRPLETAVRNRNRRWPNGVVPYFIDNAFDAGARGRILNAIRRYHETTCLRWVQRTNQRDYVHIVPRQGCFSAVGRRGGRQELSVGGTCNFARGVIMHEMMHAAGFQHEQTRTDRDQFVTVFLQNVIPGLEYNFQRYSADFIDNLQTQYDYFSIMHYPRNAFTRNGRDTIVPRQNVAIGNRNDFSTTDIFKLNTYYECGDRRTGTGTTPENNCVDNNVNCQFWASIGECQENPAYMTVNCRRSCGICSAGRAITTQDSVCMDMDERCGLWASQGECQNNPQWMLPNCEQSCGQCTQSNVACMDLNENCDMLALNGDCEINSEYMTEYCQLSCGLCQGGPGSGVDTTKLHHTCLLLEAVLLFAVLLKQ